MPISEDLNSIFKYLGVPVDSGSSQKSTRKPLPTIPQGWKRMRSAPSKEVQRIAQLILSKYRDKPYGYKVLFNADGKEYIALIEEHVGGTVEGKHPGVSVLEKNETKTTSSNSKIDTLDPSIKSKAQQLINKAKEEGINLVVTSGYRGPSEQDKLYQQGRTTKGNVVTNAKAGRSKHNFGLAFDVAPINERGEPHWPEDENLWNKIGSIGKSIGLKWGGDWTKPDRPHFEGDQSIEDLLSGRERSIYSDRVLNFLSKNRYV